MQTENKGSTNKPGPIWMDDEMRKAKSKYRYCVSKFRKCDPNVDISMFLYCKTEMLNAKEKYLNLSKEKKQSFYSNVQRKIVTVKNGKEFWAALDVFRKCGKSMTYGDISLDSGNEYFSSVFSDEQINGNLNLPFTSDPFLDAEITMRELNCAVKKLSNCKAPGNDGIPNEVWKNLTFDYKIVVLKIFNETFANPKVMPSSWSEIVIVPIYKKGEIHEPKNYRPISLLNTITKLFTTILTNRLNYWCDKYKKLSEFQAGFRSGTGCIEQAFVLNTLIQNQLRNKKAKLFCMFVDLSQAFDSVNHDILWRKLSEKGVSSKFINVIRELYSHAKAQVRIGNLYTDFFKIEKSVLQGESLSPKLFTLFLDDIVKAVSIADASSIFIGNSSVDLLLFADDVALVALSARDLQTKICALKRYFEINNLKVNLGKTKVVIFRRQKKCTDYLFMWGDIKIDIVDHFTYLGIIFHYSGSFDLACTAFINKATQAVGSLLKLFYTGRIKKFETQIQLFNSLCKSVLMYGVVLWGPLNIDKLCVFQNNFLRKLFYLPSETPRYKLLLETNATPIEIDVISLTLKFLNRIHHKCENSLVKSCFSRLANVSTAVNNKYNWYGQLSTLFSVYNIKGISKTLLFVSNLHKIQNLVNKCKVSLLNSTVSNMINSSATYKMIKSKCGTEKYLNSRLSFPCKRFYFQLRCGNSNIYWKGPCTLLGILKNGFKNCDICGNGAEDIRHIFCVCPHYKTERKWLENQLKIDIKNLQNNQFIITLLNKSHDCNVIELLFLFWKKCMHVRNFLRTY